MNIETLREYALAKQNVSEGFPFGETTLVFRAGEKIFMLVSLDAVPLQFNLKCDPDKAIELREEYPDSILPGYHMNKKHWNTVIADGSVKDRLIKEMIDESYTLVNKKKETMRNNALIIFLVLLVATAFYFLGRKNGSNQTKTDIVQNVNLVTEIAELGALDVTGTTNLKMTNRGDNDGLWNKFKNYFAESTLQLTIPFDAKYGVDMKDQKVTINTKSGLATVYLPDFKLLSLQLRLDRVDAISKTGLLTSVTIDEYIKAQKQLYEEANKTLMNNPAYLKLAREHIKFILEKYYAPMGLKVECVFGGKGMLL